MLREVVLKLLSLCPELGVTYPESLGVIVLLSETCIDESVGVGVTVVDCGIVVEGLLDKP